VQNIKKVIPKPKPKEYRKCECGCGDMHLVYVEKYTPTYTQGHQPHNHNRIQVSRSISDFINELSQEEKSERLKNSLHSDSVDHIERGKNIRDGKASLLRIIHVDGTKEEFKSYQSKEYTGLTYRQLRHRIKGPKNGVLENDSVVEYIFEYTTKHKGAKAYQRN